MHETDKEKISESRYYFQRMILFWNPDQREQGGALIIESKVYYLFNSEERIADGILTC